jgi:hypothetical protein
MRLVALITGAFLAVLTAVAVRYYVAWEHGDDIRIPGVGIVRRFPCGDYYIPSSSAEGIKRLSD